MNERRRIDEAAHHAQLNPTGVWGELTYAPDGRRSQYMISRRARRGWCATFWQRWVPRTHHVVR